MSKKTRSKSSARRARSARASSTENPANAARWLREQKLTAALYTQLPGLLEHVKKTGELPNRPFGGGLHIGLNLLIRKRGVDIKLTENERLVFDAMGRGAPYGRAILIDDDEEASRKRTR